MTTTPNFGWTLPAVGADSDTWGGELNGNWSAIDALIACFIDSGHTNLKAAGAITAANANSGGGSGPAVLNAGGFSLANNGAQTVITLVQGQIATVFACIYVNGGIGDWVKADCIYDGIQPAQTLNKVTGGSGIDLAGSGANVQVQNTSGSSQNIAWKTS
jgi:hypothetical protein